MDIKEVTKRVEKAFPEWKISRLDKAYVTEKGDHYNKREAWQIVVYEPKKDDKE